jgi:hypothetical protein
MRLGDLLIQRGVVTQDQLHESLRRKDPSERLGETLVRLGFAREEEVLLALSEQLQMPCVDLSELRVERSLLEPAVLDVVHQYQILPLDASEGVVRVALSDPFDSQALEEIGSALQQEVKPVLARASEIKRLIREQGGSGAGATPTIPDLLGRCRAECQAARDSAEGLRKKLEEARSSGDPEAARAALAEAERSLADIAARLSRSLRLIQGDER